MVKSNKRVDMTPILEHERNIAGFQMVSEDRR